MGTQSAQSLDGNNLHINPHSILPQFGSSDLIILDMSSSTFYTLSFPNPQEKVINKLAGNGLAGYVDGELGTAMFNKPKSFAVDFKGNLYVADKFNHTIRKISKSVMGAAFAWTLGLGLSCILGLIIGFMIRPYVPTWTGRTETSTLQQDMETLPNQSGQTSTDTLLRHQKRSC